MKSNLYLEEFKVNTRIKLSALWTAVMFCYIYGDYFELYVPKKVEGLLNIILGIFFTILMLLIAATSLTYWRIFYVFLAVIESIITSIIVWQAFKWQKRIVANDQ